MIRVMDESTRPTLQKLALIGITDPGQAAWPALEDEVTAALVAGLPAVLVRDKQAPDEELLPIATRIRARARACGAAFILNRRLGLAPALAPDEYSSGHMPGKS